jgi:hypothetical protein
VSSFETEGFTPVRAARTASSDRYPLEIQVREKRSGRSSPDTHIVVRDGWDELVGEGDGRLELDLERGLYTLRLEQGGASREEVIRHVAASKIEPNAPQRNSALPSFDTKDAHEYYSYTADDLAKKDTRQGKPVFGATPVGVGQLFVFVRAVQGKRQPLLNPLQSLFLYDLGGNQLTDFGPEVISQNETKGWAGFSAPAPAGSYLLRYAGLEPREMVLTVYADWQTQLFIPYEDRPLLARSSLLLAHPGQGFNPDDRTAQAVDAGLAGLQSGVNVLPREQREALLYGKFDNPMLGLIGAHLLLLQEKPDWQQLDVVLGNLDWLLPGAVDVRALRLVAALRRGEPLAAEPVLAPPILRRGLDAIIAASSASPEIIPDGGVIERIAPYLLAETPWSIWALPEALSGVADTRAKVSRLAAEKVESVPDLAAADSGPRLQQAFGDLLSSLGSEASAGIGAALQGFTSGVMSLVSDPRQPALRKIAHRMLMQGVDAALSTRSERTSLPPSSAEMPAWVRSLLEEMVARAQRGGGAPDLTALAQQAKLPLSLLRRWASQVSDGEKISTDRVLKPPEQPFG